MYREVATSATGSTFSCGHLPRSNVKLRLWKSSEAWSALRDLKMIFIPTVVFIACLLKLVGSLLEDASPMAYLSKQFKTNSFFYDFSLLIKIYNSRKTFVSSLHQWTFPKYNHYSQRESFVSFALQCLIW